MVNIVFKRTKTGEIKTLEISGHAEFGERGADILCSAISTTNEIVIIGLIEVLDTKFSLEEEDGYSKIVIPDSELAKAQPLLRIALHYLKELEIKFSNYMEVFVE